MMYFLDIHSELDAIHDAFLNGLLDEEMDENIPNQQLENLDSTEAEGELCKAANSSLQPEQALNNEKKDTPVEMEERREESKSSTSL